MSDVERLSDPGAQELLGAAKGESGAELEEFEEQVRAVFDQQARIAITPEWARFYDFGAGKLPPFLRKLAG